MTKPIKKRVRKNPRILTETLYSYVQPVNGDYARSFGKKKFGSFSAYVDVLIAADRRDHFSQKYIKT